MINGTKETLATPKLLNPADFIVVTIILCRLFSQNSYKFTSLFVLLYYRAHYLIIEGLFLVCLALADYKRMGLCVLRKPALSRAAAV